MSKDEQRLTWMAIDDTYCVSPEEERKILDRINKKIESNFEFKKREEATDKYVKGGFKLSFYGGLKVYDLGGLRTDRC